MDETTKTPRKTTKATPKKVRAKKRDGKAEKTKGKTKKSPVNSADRGRAKAAGIGLIHFRVLRALKGSTNLNSALTYRDIEAKTGYYPMLAGVMHTDEDYSLCTLGLAKQGTIDRDGRDKTAFISTAKGRKLLTKFDK